MQIEKINENQLEVFLDIDDLKRNNISIHSFMCNSAINQSFYLSILALAEDKIGFELKNYEITIESFALPCQNSFILLITRAPKKTYLKPIKLKYNILKMNQSIWLKFNNLEDFCMFCNSLITNIKVKSSLYLLNDCYFLHIKLSNIKYIILFCIRFTNWSSNISNNFRSISSNNSISSSIIYFINTNNYLINL